MPGNKKSACHALCFGRWGTPNTRSANWLLPGQQRHFATQKSKENFDRSGRDRKSIKGSSQLRLLGYVGGDAPPARPGLVAGRRRVRLPAHAKKMLTCKAQSRHRGNDEAARVHCVCGATVAWPFAAMAQEPGRTYRLGCLLSSPRENYMAFFDEL
jgi:hypothetical protein